MYVAIQDKNATNRYLYRVPCPMAAARNIDLTTLVGSSVMYRLECLPLTPKIAGSIPADGLDFVGQEVDCVSELVRCQVLVKAFLGTI